MRAASWLDVSEATRRCLGDDTGVLSHGLPTEVARGESVPPRPPTSRICDWFGSCGTGGLLRGASNADSLEASSCTTTVPADASGSGSPHRPSDWGSNASSVSSADVQSARPGWGGVGGLVLLRARPGIGTGGTGGLSGDRDSGTTRDDVLRTIVTVDTVRRSAGRARGGERVFPHDSSGGVEPFGRGDARVRRTNECGVGGRSYGEGISSSDESSDEKRRMERRLGVSTGARATCSLALATCKAASAGIGGTPERELMRGERADPGVSASGSGDDACAARRKSGRLGTARRGDACRASVSAPSSNRGDIWWPRSRRSDDVEGELSACACACSTFCSAFGGSGGSARSGCESHMACSLCSSRSRTRSAMGSAHDGESDRYV